MQFDGGEVPHPRTGEIRQVNHFKPLPDLWASSLDFSGLNAAFADYPGDEDDDDDE
jgi:hypothetical protein